jgi:ATP-dependent DNA helicase RecQ
MSVSLSSRRNVIKFNYDFSIELRPFMSAKRKHTPRVRHILQEKFGYEQLRPGQDEAIKSVLEGHDTLAIMPTGWGKSVIYQIATLLMKGPAIIVSPLIALQRDQVESIEEQDVGTAALLNSTLRTREWDETIAKLKEGNINFLFLAPEQLGNEKTLETLQRVKPSLFVVDEAHCISEWGHDFRPEYLRLGGVIEVLEHPTVLALTATASPPVREEIIERLQMRDAQIISQGFDRPNIWLSVETFHDESMKKEALLQRVAESEKPGIIYVATRKHAEELAKALQKQDVKAIHYHAGMKAREREQAQLAFMEDQVEVMVATTAFGMGIDKPNVRFVFHYDISDSVDSYYQEIGRAGRDGEEAEAILFYYPKDLGIRHFFAGGGLVDSDQVELVATLVRLHDGSLDPRELRNETGLSQTKLSTALNYLQELDVVEILSSGEVVAGKKPFHVDEATQAAMQMQEQQRQFERSRIEMMRGYAELRDCRREYLLNYFGEEMDDPCGFCDNCEAGITITEDEENVLFPINTRVIHNSWGQGMVLRYEDDKMIVLFDNVGYKTLAIEIVTERHLLKRVG